MTSGPALEAFVTTPRRSALLPLLATPLLAALLSLAPSVVRAAPVVLPEYRVLETSAQQDGLLDQALSRAAAGKVVLLDLDSTLLDNRPRTVAILRAWAEREGLIDLGGLTPEHLQEWGLDSALKRAGIAPARVKELSKQVRAAWGKEFWSDEATAYDLPIPGAARFARALWDKGATIVYVGRRVTQAAGTERSLRRFGFPLGERAVLELDQLESGRDEGNAAAIASLERARARGEVVAAIDNEGPRVDLLRERFPEALVLQMRTDGPAFLKSQGPWIHGFLRTNDAAPEPSEAGALDVPPEGAPLELVKVTDGDTIAVKDAAGEKHVIRLIGIDTPEKDGLYDQARMADKRRRHVEGYGERVVATKGSWTVARDFLQHLLEGKTITLKYDPANLKAGHRDSTGSRRILAYVWAEGSDGVQVDANMELAKNGMTLDYTPRYPHQRGAEFSKLVAEAHAEHRGYFGPEWQPF